MFYQDALAAAHADTGPGEQWQSVADLIHTRNKVLVDTYEALVAIDTPITASIDYATPPEQLEQQIKLEADPVQKIGYLVLGLHNIVYDLMTIEGNYYFVLDGKEHMRVLKEDILYYVNMSVKTEWNVYFHAFFLVLALESLFTKHFYIGIDFEYTNKKIQLMQLNFEHPIVTTSMIQIVSPPELEPVMMQNWIRMIMCNESITKILHGSDSQDIPYVYGIMLENDPELIIQFTKGLVDTRFPCEYYKLNRGSDSDNKCAIYDQDPARSAVYYFKVVSDQQQQQLTDMLDSMLHHADIQWNIHKIPRAQVMYALCDVLFLKYLYYRIIYVATKDESTDLGKKAVIEFYKNILRELVQLTYLDNNKIIMLKAKCKEDVDIANNYFIRKANGANVNMNAIYNEVSQNLETVNPRASIDKIVKVSHFKAMTNIIIKRMVYGHVSRTCKVFVKGSMIWTDKLPNQFIFEFLDKMGFTYLARMFRELDKVLLQRVQQVCSR